MVVQVRERPVYERPVAERTSWPSSKLHTGSCRFCSEVFCSPGVRRCCSKLCDDRFRTGALRSYPCAKCRRGELSRRTSVCLDCQAETRRSLRQRAKHRRRALKAGAEVVESFTLKEIAERDRYRCGICRGRVAMAKTVPHPKAPTIDHILPLAAHGDHSRANAQLAHFLCNSLKSHTGGAQLALLG